MRLRWRIRFLRIPLFLVAPRSCEACMQVKWNEQLNAWYIHQRRVPMHHAGTPNLPPVMNMLQIAAPVSFHQVGGNSPLLPHRGHHLLLQHTGSLNHGLSLSCSCKPWRLQQNQQTGLLCATSGENWVHVSIQSMLSRMLHGAWSWYSPPPHLLGCYASRPILQEVQ